MITRPSGRSAQPIGLIRSGLSMLLVAGGATASEPAVAEPAEVEAELKQQVDRLHQLGLQITADPRKIEAATSEAAYFMFAQRKDFRPRYQPFEPPESGHWLDRKPVFAPGADRKAIPPVFDDLVDRMGYDRVRIYMASVHYGISGFARFTLYKLERASEEAADTPAVLLGDADYVINLP